MSNYPDGMNESNNDPRSPNYDDQGEEVWCEKRYREIKSDLNLLDLDFDEFNEAIGKVVIAKFNDRSCIDKSNMVNSIEEKLSEFISDQVDREWSENADTNND